MSEIRTSSDIRQSAFVPFPDCPDFGHFFCQKSGQKSWDKKPGHFGHFRYVYLKKINKNCVAFQPPKSGGFCPDFGHFFCLKSGQDFVPNLALFPLVSLGLGT